MNTESHVMRRLTIKSYHVTSVQNGDAFSFTETDRDSHTDPECPYTYQLTIPPDCAGLYADTDDLICDIQIQIVPPDQRHRYIHSVMDIIPISTKVLGKIGEGITHTITGLYVVLTGVDEAGTPICAFGNSDGMLDEQIKFDRAGTPGAQDSIILFDVTLKEHAGVSRSGPNAAHHACDLFCQEIRKLLKATSGSRCTEKHVYEDIIRPDRKKVALVKLVSGQGSMYDTHFLGNEPSAYEGSRSVIDITGAPILLSPNEYRDGAIRAMY